MYIAAREDSKEMPPTATAIAAGEFPRVLPLRVRDFKRVLNHFKASRGITPAFHRDLGLVDGVTWRGRVTATLLLWATQ